MPGIYPVASSRVSDALIQARLLSQFEHDQQALIRLQDQVSTGYRITTPSDDASASIRAMSLQRILEQKEQAKTNLSSADSFNSATDTALSGAADLLISIRAMALSAMNAASNPEQRSILQNEINHAIEQFLDIGNRQFRGRYLFAGSETGVRPFSQDDKYVVYNGNVSNFQSYVDINRLADANITGADAFGAISQAVEGEANLNPSVTLATRLADLRGGRGISAGSFSISDGTSTTIIDIRGCSTVGDVVEMIENNPPAGRDLNVSLSHNGLILDLDDAGGGSLVIQEMQGGVTASELGIVTPGAGTGPFTGNDLDPLIRSTTRVRDLLGSRASARLQSAGDSNDIHVEATTNGADYNGVTVRYIDGVVMGENATASYDAGTKTLTIDISPGVTRAANVVDAINQTGLFTATLDETFDRNNNGSGVVELAAVATTSGGTGEQLDLDSGIQIVNGDATHTIRFTDAETIEDLLNLLNGSEANVFASINATGTGIDIRSRMSGTNFMIAENGGRTASQLGLRTFTTDTPLSSLNNGLGVHVVTGTDLIIERRDGVRLDIDLSDAETIGDVLDLINNHPTNVGNPVVAQLAAIGNGIVLSDANAAGTGNLIVRRAASNAAWDLGLVTRNQEQAVAATTGPGIPQSITGRDVNPQEPNSVFNSLIKLSEAIAATDLPGIERTLGMLDDNFQDLLFVRAELGARSRSLDIIGQRIDREEVDFREALSDEIDADLAESISELAARQANLEASLKLISQSLNLSVFNFI